MKSRQAQAPNAETAEPYITALLCTQISTQGVYPSKTWSSSVGNMCIFLGNPELKYLKIIFVYPTVTLYRFIINLYLVTKFYLKKQKFA